MKTEFQKIHSNFIKVIVSLVLVFGFISFLTLDTAGTSIEIIQNQITGRGPASIATPERHTEIVNVDCSDFDKEISVKARQVRIIGKLCDAKLFTDVTLKNETQPNEPTLFKKKGTFTTDYINLVQGANVLSLRLKDKNQKEIIKNLTVIR